MSQEDLRQFLEALGADPSLQEALRAEGADPVAIAREAGYTFSLEEWQESLSILTEEELESLAGGNQWDTYNRCYTNDLNFYQCRLNKTVDHRFFYY